MGPVDWPFPSGTVSEVTVFFLCYILQTSGEVGSASDRLTSEGRCMGGGEVGVSDRGVECSGDNHVAAVT